MEYRLEHDSMGEMRVPADRLYGAQTQRSLEHFSIGGETMPMEVIYAIVQIKKAVAMANGTLGKLTDAQSTAICRACDRILQGGMEKEFPLCVWQTGSGTQTNMNVNEVIARMAAEDGVALHPNDHVNLGQSTNDVFPSALHVATVLLTEKKLLPAMEKLEKTLFDLACRYQSIVKLGRTHLQDATPVTLGQEISAWQEMARCTREMIVSATERLRALALGGTAVGTGLNADPKLSKTACQNLTEICGTAFFPAENKFHALSSRDALCFWHGALRTTAADLYKLASDVRLLGSGPRSGIGELVLPANEPGSSIMPGKVNPTQCEALTMVCARVMGNDVSVGIAASQGQLELNVYLPLFARVCTESARLLSDAVESFVTHCLAGIIPNTARIRENLERSLMLVTALSPRIGYENAANVAKTAHEDGTTLQQAAEKLGLLTLEEFDRLVDPLAMTNAKG